MLSFNILPIFKARGIDKPYTFLIKAGLSPHIVTRIINNKPQVLRLDHIELLCSLLVCEPNDLLVFIPNKNNKLSDNHPLMKLRYQAPNENWQEIIAEIPFKQLNEMTKAIASKKDLPEQ